MKTRPGANPAARILAGAALIAAAIVLIVVISSSVGGSGGADSTAQVAKQGRSKPKDKYYVVQAGDSLSSIAAKEGVSEAKLTRLNPNLDPQALQPQNCVDLIPHGCRKLAAQSGG